MRPMTPLRWMSILLIVSISILITSCNNKDEIKQAAMQAMTQQATMTSYQFEGEATLQLDPSVLSFKTQLAQQLFAIISSSTISWQGALQVAPLSMEMVVHLSPKASDKTFDIPVVIRDNLLYVQLPALNEPDEYTVFELLPSEENSSAKPPFEQLSKAPQLLTELLAVIVGQADVKWFDGQVKSTSSSSAKAQAISIEISNKNKVAFNQIIQNRLPQLANMMETSGLMSSDQASTVLQLQQFDWEAPTKISLSLDKQGFMTSQTIEANLKLLNASAQQADKTYRLAISQSYSHINEPYVPATPLPTKTILWSKIVSELQ